jgi:hypothetical protein
MACARITSAGGVDHHVQVSGTTTRGVLALADWLTTHGGMQRRHGVDRRVSAARWLETTLVQAAWAAVRKKDSCLRAQFLRLTSRRGPETAIIAVAASMLRAMYFMLRRGVPYRDLGGSYFDRRDEAFIARHLGGRLHDLGYRVGVTAAA